jgi:type IV pilus assembly protein PilY1
MNPGIPNCAGRALLALLCIMNLLLALFPACARGDVSSMRNYCSTPPDVSGFKPNLLIMMDNSASMYDLAYTNPDNYCLDDSADTFEKSSSSYTGYFDPGKIYSYNNSGGYFELSSDPIPTASCNLASTSYLCVNKSNQVNVTATGNFLNWLTTSKLDIEKKALTGGNYDTEKKWLQSETHGCRGKRFVKMVGNSPVSFAVRGPVPGETGYLYRASYGGITSIEVYGARFNKGPCTLVVADWLAGKDDLKEKAQACLGSQWDDPPAKTVPSKAWVRTEIMSDCFLRLAKGDALEGSTGQLGTDCAARYSVATPDLIPANADDAVCGAGYLGQCRLSKKWNAACFSTQMDNFCNAITISAPTDPSSSAIMPGTGVNLPDFVLDAGITNLGPPLVTLSARIHLDPAPQGTIQSFSRTINFGAMVFNYDGAGSECSQAGSPIPCLRHCSGDPAPQRECRLASDCSSGPCSQDAPSDGGRIISYINQSPLGDHTKGSGLIASLDAVTANSWTPLAESFYEAIGYFANRTDLRLQDADFDAARPPSQFACQRNNILIITDGVSTADRNDAVNTFVAGGLAGYLADPASGRPALQTTGTGALVSAAPPYQGSYNLDDLAWIARNKSNSNTGSPIRNLSDYLTSYVVYTGAPCGVYDANGNCTTADEGVAEKMMQLVASKGGGTIVNARNPDDLGGALRNILTQIGSSANSGTGASILSTGDSNSAVYLQEQFYPSRSFDGGLTAVSWIGEMQGLWYFIDPMVAGSTGDASTIREDTGGLHTLDLKKDRVLQFSYDPNLKSTRARLFLDADGNGSPDPVQPAGYPLSVSLDEVQSLWRAGLSLWNRDAGDRTIYTQTDGSKLIPFLDSTSTGNQALLQAAGADDARSVVSFVQGTDSTPGTRDRGVSADGLNKRVWKLGDIISSTPVLQSATGLGSYNLASPRGYGDSSYSSFTAQNAYKGRGTVYVGANDGMLHAFRLGGLTLHPGTGTSWPSSQKATLSGGSGLGKEEWAFVPKNALPYLRYLMDPNYSHLQYVDGSLTLADVSLGDPALCDRSSYWNCTKDLAAGTNWRTVLIGGMGLGGAARGGRPGEPLCSEGVSGTCVKSPLPGAGFSSYFALDVTGQNKDGTGPPPTLLWEFSPPGLGFATSGAAIIKINARTGQDSMIHDHDRNGRWFAVFASGPTGAVDPGSCQFQGKSDQNLKLFVVDLGAVPPLVENANYWVIDTGIPNAFAGSMSGAGIDTDRWKTDASGYYEDNALYLGYTQQVNPGEGWVKGGVLRLLTRENPDPGQWVASKVIDGIGPVSGAIAKLQDRKNHNLWLYFGTGRYFFNQDDMTAGRFLYGVKEPCYTAGDTLNPACSTTVLSPSGLSDATAAGVTDTAASKGWQIGLDAASGGFGGERLLSTPTTLTAGSIFFATFKPSAIACTQGNSYLWKVGYDSGGSTVLNGKAVVALTSGNSQDIPLANWSDKGGRRGPQMTGRPGGVKIISNSGLKPLKKIIHIQER